MESQLSADKANTTSSMRIFFNYQIVARLLTVNFKKKKNQDLSVAAIVLDCRCGWVFFFFFKNIAAEGVIKKISIYKV
jgi:hypothetical protein